MNRTAAQVLIAGSLLLAAVSVGWVMASRAASGVIEAGFWFEQVHYESSRLGALTAADVQTIEAVALDEIRKAFTGLRINFADRRDAMYSIRVVQALRDLRVDRTVGVAGESRSVAGFGGRGAVGFEFLAAFAVRYAPKNADRSTIVTAIGRGIGRSAVHEFAHLLLGSANIHGTTDALSYEHPSVDRRDQYYGELHWDVAWPLLRRRAGGEG